MIRLIPVALLVTACSTTTPCLDYELRWVNRATFIHGTMIRYSERIPVCVLRAPR